MDATLCQRMLMLKETARSGWIRAGVNEPESVADHSWGIAALALACCPPELDIGKVLTLSVIHDLPEVITGDITPHDGISRSDKQRKESLAADELFQGRPDLRAHWQEYEQNQTAEALFVHQLDKLEMGLWALHLKAQGHCGMEEFVNSAKSGLRDDHLIRILERCEK